MCDIKSTERTKVIILGIWVLRRVVSQFFTFLVSNHTVDTSDTFYYIRYKVIQRDRERDFHIRYIRVGESIDLLRLFLGRSYHI